MSWIGRIVMTVLLLGGMEIPPALRAGPTTAPTVDLSTPRATLRSLNQAMREGDVDVIKRLFFASTPMETQMVEADAQMAGALAELRVAAIKAFGSENAKILTGESAAGTAESLARIEAADIAVDGDTATVHYSNDKESPFVLKKVGNEWKIVVSQLGKPLNPAALEQRISDLAVQRRVVQEIAAEIRSGHFASSERAREAWQSRILQAATSQTAKPQ
jgi:hypothetical protein